LDNITKSCVVLGVDYKDVYNYMSQNFGKVIKISKSSLQITNI
jgi:Tfp pilus assembly protein PilP